MTNPILLTRDATLDDMSASDYRDMYDEVRGKGVVADREYLHSLDQFIVMVRSEYSKGHWSRYHRGELVLTRTMRNELRRAMGQKLLPPTVAEATAAASPDAAVWQVGEGVPDIVIMLPHGDPITLHVNGSASVVDAQQPAHGAVRPRTRTQRSARYTTSQMQRRRALCVSWRAVVDAGLTALEQEAND